MSYFERDDVLHLMISDEAEAGSVEISPNIAAELNVQGGLIGIEIVRVNTFIRDSIISQLPEFFEQCYDLQP
jgi:hypothetical protein